MPCGGYRERKILFVAVEFRFDGPAQLRARFDGYRRVAVDQQFDLVAGRAGAAHDEHIRALKFAFSRFDYLFRVDHVSEIRSYMV